MNFTTPDRSAIGGKVTLDSAAGAGLGGVTMTLTGGASFTPQTVKTDSYGTYSFVNLPVGNYTLTPSKDNYNFGPARQVVTGLTGARPGTDFVATLKSFTISGVVKNNGWAMPDVAVRLTRQTPAGFEARTMTTDYDGRYSFAYVPAGYTYTVTPAPSGFRFAPASQSVVNLRASQTTINFSARLYTISGRVVRAGTTKGIGWVTITLTSPTFYGFPEQTAETDDNGYYTFAALPAGRSYTLKAARIGFTFSPATRTVTNLSGNIPSRPYTSFTGTGP
jgi:hypothetical protein